MAARTLLEISNGLASSSDDEADSAIWDHDLHMVLAIPQGRCSTSGRVARLFLSAVQGAHSAVLNDSVDGRLDLSTTSPRAGDLALAKGTAIGGSQELDTAVGVGFDPSQILTLSADDKANEAGLDLDRLSVVVSASERGSLSATASARRKGAATRRRRVGTVAAIISTLASPTVVPV